MGAGVDSLGQQKSESIVTAAQGTIDLCEMNAKLPMQKRLKNRHFRSGEHCINFASVNKGFNPVVVRCTDHGFIAQLCDADGAIQGEADVTLSVTPEGPLFGWLVGNERTDIPLFGLGQLNNLLATIITRKWKPAGPTRSSVKTSRIKMGKTKIVEKCLALQTKSEFQRLCANLPADMVAAHRKTFAVVGPGYKGRLLCDWNILGWPSLIHDIATHSAAAAIVELAGDLKEGVDPWDGLREGGWLGYLSPTGRLTRRCGKHWVLSQAVFPLDF
jgi:hypothetical protein